MKQLIVNVSFCGHDILPSLVNWCVHVYRFRVKCTICTDGAFRTPPTNGEILRFFLAATSKYGCSSPVVKRWLLMLVFACVQLYFCFLFYLFMFIFVFMESAFFSPLLSCADCFPPLQGAFSVIITLADCAPAACVFLLIDPLPVPVRQDCLHCGLYILEERYASFTCVDNGLYIRNHNLGFFTYR